MQSHLQLIDQQEQIERTVYSSKSQLSIIKTRSLLLPGKTYFQDGSLEYVKEILFLVRDNTELAAEVLKRIEISPDKHKYDQRFFSLFANFFMDNPFQCDF